MKTMQLPERMPGYRLNDYSIVLSPPRELRDRIRKMRQEFSVEFGTDAIGGPPQLTLVRFRQLEMMEARLNNRIHSIALAQKEFRIELLDFGSFPTHTIVFKTASRTALQQLSRALRGARKLMDGSPAQKPHFIDEPRITLARKLTPGIYEKAWLQYQEKHFRAAFIAGSMLLLRRREGESYSHPIDQFLFRNLPVETRQGSFF